MPFAPDQQLLHYRLTEKIGEGGMGVVWKARDTNLDRDVAIKILPEGIAAEPERLARFEREAKLLAVLDHPNIAAVYGLHEADGQRFIAMEYIAGEDLAQRLARGPLPTEDALDIGRQVAAALEAAHEQGVIHRDLKPANIKCTPDGKVKVLDLGLAKALVQETSGDATSVSMSPTMTSAGTVAGTLLGTAGYMSPEQAKGKAVDRRADIWAFGVVLHEMLSGRTMFEAETISETLAAVLRDEVSLVGLPAGVPASVTQLIRRCLDRDPRTRLRDIGEARIALSSETLATGEPAAGAVAAVAAPAPSGASRLLPWALVVLLAAVAAFALWRASSGGPPAEKETLTLVVPVPKDLRLTAGPLSQRGAMALSPDGKTLALVLAGEGTRMLHVRRLDEDNLVELPGTESAVTPFFSPDSQWIGFFTDDKLKKVPVGGGAPITLCDSDGDNRGGAWTDDDVIVFVPHYNTALLQVSGAGGDPEPLSVLDKEAGERTHRWPHAVAGEDLVLFTVGSADSPENYDRARIDAIRPSTGERVTLYEGASIARYVPSGHLVFGRESFLFAVPFDLDRLEVRGKPVPVVENVLTGTGSGVVHADFARNGLLAYVSGSRQVRQLRLVWRNREGVRTPLEAPVRGYGGRMTISPDGKRIATGVAGDTSVDIWTYHIERETLTRLTFEGINSFPVWSPDGSRLAFASVRGNALTSVYVKAADGSGAAEKFNTEEQLRSESVGLVAPTDWTRDGRYLIVEYADEYLRNIAALPQEGGEPIVLAATPATERSPTVSPNGRWVAYRSDEAGESQVFVQAFPGPGGKWQISSAGGDQPRWSPDGRELFFSWLDSFYVVSIDDSSGSLKVGRPEVLFDDLEPYMQYDVLDSNRFLFSERVGDDTRPAGVTVVVNWLDELERLVPD